MNDKAKKSKQQEEEPKIKMYRLTIDVSIEAASIDDARLQAKTRVAELVKTDLGQKVQRVVRPKYSSRSDRLAEAISKVNDAISEIESLKSECDDWYNNLPENFQNGEKGEMLQNAVSTLEDLQSNLESAVSDGENVEFPGMFS